MKKILIYLLLFVNLSTGLAFAMDIHPEAMAAHSSTSIDLLTVDNEHSDGDLHHNDHCCHGSAHLVGLIFSPSTPFVPSNHNDLIMLSQTPTVLYITPLLRPPIL